MKKKRKEQRTNKKNITKRKVYKHTHQSCCQCIVSLLYELIIVFVRVTP